MVYLLHFDRPICDCKRSAQHYVGYSDDVGSRLKVHGTVNGSKIMRALKVKGIGYKVARIWEGDRSLERRIKRYKKNSRLCPICSGDVAYKRLLEV